MRLENSVNARSYLFFNDPFKASQQKTIVESVDNFPGAFLTIHELQACSNEVTALQTFEILLQCTALAIIPTCIHPQLSLLTSWN